MPDRNLSFWEHLDELRSVLIKSVCAWFVCSVVAFFLKEPLFKILFAPLGNTQRLINIDVVAPFLTHIQVSMCIGFVVALPMIIAWLYSFIAPAISTSGKRQYVGFVASAYMLFAAGVVLNYFIIFPFSFHFLSSYKLSNIVVNQISLTSYISLLLILSIMMGLLFEIPVVAWLLSRIGIVRQQHLKHFRKHVFVGILIIAAVITPTGDPFTLLMVTLPVYLLYELSIFIVK